MRDLLYIADRFDDLLKELPVSSYAGFLEEARRKVRLIAGKEAFYVDIFRSTNASPESKKLAKSLADSATGSSYKPIIKDDLNYSIRVFEDIFPSMGFVLLDEEMQHCDVLSQYFRRNDSVYKVVFIINLLSDGDNLKNYTRQFSHYTKTIIIPHEAVSEKSIASIIESAIDAASMEKIKKLAYLNSIRPLFSFLDEILASENKAANTRKLLNIQNSNITRKEEQTLNNNELTGNLRKLIQKSTQELEKSYKIKYEDLNKPNTGRFSIVAEERCNLLKDFERKVLAEKSEKYETSIPKYFLDNFVNDIASTIKTELGKDEAFIKSSFENLLAQINIQLKNRGINTLDSGSIYPPFPEKENTIHSFCYMSKTYTGEMVKKGAIEYLVALKDYTGLMVVLGGVLAPLSIVATASDTGIFKYVSTWTKILTGLISLLMVLYGIYDLRKRIPKKRIEELEKELNKAKDILQQEAKRMFNDCSGDWLADISNWLSDTSQNISQQIEQNIQNLQTKKANQMNLEKLQQQKQQLSIDLLLQNIQSAEQVKDELSIRYKDMLAETEKDLKL